MKTIRLVLVTIAAAILLAGCESDNSTATSGSRAGFSGPSKREMLIAPEKINAIVPGMTADLVTQTLGKPREVSPYTAAGVAGEIWTYYIAASNHFEQVTTGMREIPGFDPITNQPRNTMEPIITNRRTTRYTTLELLLVDGKVIERRPGRDVQVTFD